jgi:hypothetical protein
MVKSSSLSCSSVCDNLQGVGENFPQVLIDCCIKIFLMIVIYITLNTHNNALTSALAYIAAVTVIAHGDSGKISNVFSLKCCKKNDTCVIFHDIEHANIFHGPKLKLILQ